MSKVVLDTVLSGYNLDKINANFAKIATALNTLVLYRNNPVGEPNQIESDIDVNNKRLYNVGDLTVTGTLAANGINFDTLNSALVWRGPWSSVTSYVKSDGVSYNGSSYICTVPNTNDAPEFSLNWDILAAQGSVLGAGDVNGPASSVAGHITSFSNTSGKVIADSGVPIANVLQTSNIGSTVQAYDVNTAKTNVTQTFVNPQRGVLTTVSTGTFDLSLGNKFVCNPVAAITLSFVSNVAGQGGSVILNNTGGYPVSAAATTIISASTLSVISTSGKYLLGYETDGTNSYVVASKVST